MAFVSGAALAHKGARPRLPPEGWVGPGTNLAPEAVVREPEEPGQVICDQPQEVKPLPVVSARCRCIRDECPSLDPGRVLSGWGWGYQYRSYYEHSGTHERPPEATRLGVIAPTISGRGPFGVWTTLTSTEGNGVQKSRGTGGEKAR